MYDYGVKVRTIAFFRPGALPLLEALFVTQVSEGDLPAMRSLADEIYFACFIGDKAYCDMELRVQMKNQDAKLITTIKRKRNVPSLTLFQKAYRLCSSNF